MARPKGSTNKPKVTGNNLQILNFAKDIEGSAVTRKNTSYGFVNWGAKNNYPNILLSLYNESPTHHSCVNFEVQATIGGGIDFDAMQQDGSQIVPNYSESWDSLLRKISTDYFIYNSYAIEIIKNKDDRTFSFWHIPLDKVRWTEYDEDGQITQYAISNDWARISQNQPIFLDAFDMRDASVVERGKAYLYVYRSYSPTMEYYTAPLYTAGIKAIQAEIEYLNYDLKSAVNSFVPAGMLVLNEVETDEQRREIIDNVQRMFQGSENANNLMVSFRSNVDENKPEFIPFQASMTNVNLYDSANQRNVSRILAAHSIPNASLVGMPDINGSGFASEADKLQTAYDLWNTLSGNYHRSCVVGSFNTMLKLNGVDTELILKPLSFVNTSDSNTAEVEDGDEQNTSTGNIEEQVV